MVTEAEAKNKWCPFARVVVQSMDDNEFSPAGNRVQVQQSGKTTVHGPIKTATCLASGCMAWRKRVSSHARDKRESEDERIGKFEAGGYCGLAGRPE